MKPISTAFIAFFMFIHLSQAKDMSLIKKIEGVYKKKFPNALMTGEKYESENILEIVPFEKDSAYLRFHLEFSNGHSCTLWGIAKEISGELIYREPQPIIPDQPCILTLFIEGDSLKTKINEVEHGCQAYCGNRGTLNAARFKLNTRKPIRYLSRLKSSREYKEAVEQPIQTEC
ncbi:MAG: hypothetical protein R3A45_05300 [Bdellovibrionota bacterium]